MARPMRSLTEPPGLRLSTLAITGVRVFAARRDRGTNGVLPTASRIVSRISAGMALHRSIRLFRLAILAAVSTGAADSDRRERVVNALLAWYALNQRDLPWRKSRDPYAILV